jgi:hypothetical protein
MVRVLPNDAGSACELLIDGADGLSEHPQRSLVIARQWFVLSRTQSKMWARPRGTLDATW